MKTDDDTKGDYKVGPGKPPKHTRFKKGQSGNPGGRPPKRATLKDKVFDELGKRVKVTENGRTRSFSMEELIAKRMVTDAAKGNARARADVLKLNEETNVAPEGQPEKGPELAKDAEILARYRKQLIADMKGDK
jgi:hypothetical protein